MGLHPGTMYYYVMSAVVCYGVRVFNASDDFPGVCDKWAHMTVIVSLRTGLKNNKNPIQYLLQLWTCSLFLSPVIFPLKKRSRLTAAGSLKRQIHSISDNDTRLLRKSLNAVFMRSMCVRMQRVLNWHYLFFLRWCATKCRCFYYSISWFPGTTPSLSLLYQHTKYTGFSA